MSRYDYSGVTLTLGGVQKALRVLEDRVEDIANGISIRGQTNEWSGTDRRADTAFSDKQTERIKALFDERAEVHVGRYFFRLVLSAIGTFCIAGAGILYAYLKLKG